MPRSCSDSKPWRSCSSVAGTHGWVVPLNTPNTTDFVSFYAAGSLADAGNAQAAYDPVQHLTAEVAATEPGIKHVIFVYPPVFIMLCALLARLPYLTAFAVFEGLTLIPCLLVLRGSPVSGTGLAFIPLLAFPAVAIDIGNGQNALLTAALFGRRDAAGRQAAAHRRIAVRRALLQAAFRIADSPGAAGRRTMARHRRGGGLGAGAGRAVRGDAWLAKLGGVHRCDHRPRHTTYESGQIDFAAFVSSFRRGSPNGGSPGLAYAVQGAVSLAAAALVVVVWRRNLSLPVRAATLASATVVALPLILFYDF